MQTAADRRGRTELREGWPMQTHKLDGFSNLDVAERACFKKGQLNEAHPRSTQAGLREGTFHTHRKIAHAVGLRGVVEAIAGARSEEQRLEIAAMNPNKPRTGRAWDLEISDDWPAQVPVTEAELDLFEVHFGPILDTSCWARKTELLNGGFA
jgi:hypothetical protein